MMTEATLVQIAGAIDMSKRGVAFRAEAERWPFTEKTGRGGTRRVYAVATLPTDVQAAIALLDVDANAIPAAAPDAQVSYDREALYEMHRQRPIAMQEIGMTRATLVRQVKALEAQFTLKVALNQVADANDESWRTLERWTYMTEGYIEADWHVVLTPAYKGGKRTTDLPQEAWDWLIGFYFTRKQPTLKNAYERLQELAKKNNWNLPSVDTIGRRLEQEIPITTRVLLRQGPEALAKMFPPQRRDKTVFAAGEAVTGDGLKFDRLWIIFPDGEIINTATAWVWADIRTSKILAYRLAKTENTDLFRLATYDLTAICRPAYAWVDNTVVAANKAMTGRSGNRHRFHDKANDPIGLLQHIGMDVRFTNPDKVMGSPGAKPIERSFGIGGIHDAVATSPRLKGKGYSRATAITFDLFAKTVAEEIQRFNAKTKRRSAVCRGVLSYDEAFAESFKAAEVVKLTEGQRQILLLMPEVVRCNKRSGELSLKAGRGPMGRNRFWSPELLELQGEEVVAYYDPENIAGVPISVYSLDGRFICMADNLGDVGFNDTVKAREWAKNKSRFVKGSKIAAAAEQRMTALEIGETYPEQDQAPVVPQPGIVRGNFGQKLVARPVGDPALVEAAGETAVAMLAKKREPNPSNMNAAQRYDWWCELDAKVKAGEQLSESAAHFHAHFSKTQEFRTFKGLEDGFGGGMAARA